MLYVQLGMSSALETRCGQAFGAGNLNMLGVYMQRSWIILLFTSLLLTPLYIYSPPILRLFGETVEISQAAGQHKVSSLFSNISNRAQQPSPIVFTAAVPVVNDETNPPSLIVPTTFGHLSIKGEFALWMIPQLFAYAFNFPIQKFLQAQRKVLVMAWLSALVLVMHAALSWLFMLKWGWALVGAAVMLNTSWWLIVILQFIYILITKSDGAWSGFSWLAFSDLWGFVKLSLASGVILEIWFLMALVVIIGRLPNPLIPVDAISICMNLEGWDTMIAFGFNAAISVRVSNELGAGNYRQAKISVLVVSVTSVVIGFVIFIVVQRLVSLRFHCKRRCGSRNNKAFGHVGMHSPTQQPSASVAVGAGWQSLVAYINIACYYFVGLPAGILLGFKFGLGAMGVWGGMIGGICLQTVILIIVTALTNWKNEADEAGNRVRKWGGSAVAN
ncbi:LOW QUALITY PROTEIN: hypothetical protein Cgig2_027411 [Carnegiea gigantea]|uniref:Protein DETOXIFICATION n=1 Tax=Carnegiea gigantea TaxID=171969 RepID=A0A9Q1JU57_9CARY|nr:LOW QUALITY PROTEIN: hypothetical protein Cgig2_027411 [Carnegiea gigantea]